MNSDLKVLIVDDDPDYLEDVTDLLIDLGVEKIETALSGVSALEVIAKQDFNLVLLDVCLPDKDGTEILSDILSKQLNLYVVIVTGLELSIEEQRIVLHKGARDFIVKPLSSGTLKNIIESCQEIIM